MGVNGWYRANVGSGSGSVSTGTNAELRKSSRRSTCGRLLAVSALSVTRPIATEIHATATDVSTSTPAAAIHATGPVVGRNPTRTPMTTTSIEASTTSITVPRTGPASTADREIAIVRKRAMIPLVMSIATEIA